MLGKTQLKRDFVDEILRKVAHEDKPQVVQPCTEKIMSFCHPVIMSPCHHVIMSGPPSGKRPSSVQEVVWQCSLPVDISRALVVVIFDKAGDGDGFIFQERQGHTNTKRKNNMVLFGTPVLTALVWHI